MTMVNQEFILCTDGVREVVSKEQCLKLTQALCEANKHEYKIIRLGGKSLTLETTEIIASRLKECEGIHTLDIADIIASQPEEKAKEVLSHLGAHLNVSTLLHLDVSDNALGLKGIQALTPLLSSSRTSLESITLNNNGLDGRAARLVSLLLTTEKFTHSKCNVTEASKDDDEDVCDDVLSGHTEKDIGTNTCLRKFHTFNNLLKCAGARGFSRLFRCSPSLVDVRISSTRIATEGALSLATSLTGLSLLRLDLSDNSFDIEGCNAIAKNIISCCPQLTHLNLAAVAMHDEGIAALASAIKEAHPPLECLDLSCNEITSDGADALAQCLTQVCQTLKVLKLAENELSNDGVKIATNPLNNSDVLETLDLSVNEISKFGAMILITLIRKLCALNCLELNGNCISTSDVQNIKLALDSVNGARVLGDMDLNDDEYEEEINDEDDNISRQLGELQL